MVEVDDSTHAVIITSLIILIITILQAFKILSNWWTAINISYFLSVVIFELWNTVTAGWSSVLNITSPEFGFIVVTTLAIIIWYGYDHLGGVVICGILLLLYVLGILGGSQYVVNWLNIPLIAYFVIALILLLLLYAIYRQVSEISIIQEICIGIMTIFICSIAVDSIWDWSTSATDNIHVLTFNLAFSIIVIIVTIFYIVILVPIRQHEINTAHQKLLAEALKKEQAKKSVIASIFSSKERQEKQQQKEPLLTDADPSPNRIADINRT
jgi:hypothetical protein